jgi:RAD51-like protein 2
MTKSNNTDNTSTCAPNTTISTGNNNMMKSSSSMMMLPITHLPLRPSSIQLLRQHGFDTVSDVYESKNIGGFNNFAAELGCCTIQQAHSIYHEIDQLVNNNNSSDSAHQQKEPVVRGTTTDNTTTSSSSSTFNLNVETSLPQNNLLLSSQPSACYNNYNSRRRITAVSAFDLVQEMEHNSNMTGNMNNNAYIITFCRELDQLLGGGIPLGIVTEIAGSPGTGKSQMCMQYSVTVSLPISSGGVNGQTIYIDTEGSFSPERCFSMSIALIDHVNGILSKQHKRQQIQRQKQQQQQHQNGPNTSPIDPVPKWDVTVEEILDSIHVFRVHDETSLIAVLNGPVPIMIEQLSKTDKPIRLIVIDSIAFPFRCCTSVSSFSSNTSNSNNNYYAVRTKQLSTIISDLNILANTYNLAVIAINQMTTKRITQYNSNENNENTTPNDALGFNNNTNNIIVPALGESWAHSVTIRLVLSSSLSMRNNNNNNSKSNNTNERQQRRTCTLVKSPSLPSGSIDYQILESGIRSIDYRPPLLLSNSTTAAAVATASSLSIINQPVQAQQSSGSEPDDQIVLPASNDPNSVKRQRV